MVIPRKFHFQNDIHQILLPESFCSVLFALTSNSQHTLELRWFNLILFHNGEDTIFPFFCFITIFSCSMFPADCRRRFSPLPVERSLFTFRQGANHELRRTGFAFRLVLSQSIVVHVLTRVTDGDHHHSTDVVIIGGATWKLNRPVNSRWDYRIQIPLSNM